MGTEHYVILEVNRCKKKQKKTKVKTCKTIKEALDHLKKVYLINIRTKNVQVEPKKWIWYAYKEGDRNIKDYTNKLLLMPNKIRILREALESWRLPRRFECEISSFVNNK